MQFERIAHFDLTEAKDAHGFGEEGNIIQRHIETVYRRDTAITSFTRYSFLF